MRAVAGLTTTTGLTAAGSGVLWLSDRSQLSYFASDGAGVSALCAAMTVFARGELHQAVLRAIACGDDHRGVREFDAGRAKLMRQRAQLARTLETYVTPPAVGMHRIGYSPFSAAQNPATCQALRELSDLLRGEPAPSPRAVAICTILITDGITSPLHGGSTALEEELHRVRYLA